MEHVINDSANVNEPTEQSEKENTNIVIQTNRFFVQIAVICS